MADTQINLDNKSFYLNYGGGWKKDREGRGRAEEGIQGLLGGYDLNLPGIEMVN